MDTLFPQNEIDSICSFYRSHEPATKILEYRALTSEIGHVKNLFYGDSITSAWPLHEFFPGVSILNRGIGGDNPVGLHIRLADDVFPYTPERVFMMIGINGIGAPENVLFERITHVGREIIEHGSELFLCSICPLRYPDQWNRFQYQDKIVHLNGRLREWAQVHASGYLDYHSELKDKDGQLKEEYARPDGTHLRLAAYVAMSKLVKSYLA